MTGLTRTRALITMLTCALALLVGAASAGAAAAEPQESQQTAAQQLAAGQVTSATINKRLRRVHVVLKDGTRAYYRYAPKEEPTVAEALKKKHVKVTVLTPSAAKKEATKGGTKHKIRYIAGGALLLIVIVVGTVLLVRRRRMRLAE